MSFHRTRAFYFKSACCVTGLVVVTLYVLQHVEFTRTVSKTRPLHSTLSVASDHDNTYVSESSPLRESKIYLGSLETPSEKSPDSPPPPPPPSPPPPTPFQRDPLRVLYNRVPKCGSEAVLQVVGRLRVKNKFNFVPTNIFGHQRLSLNEQREFAETFNQEKTPFVKDRHLYFLNFSRFDQPWPTYINVIRDPFGRMVSRFYFNLNGRVSRQRHRNTDHLTFDKCFAMPDNQTGQCPETRQDKLLLYFCGHLDICSREHDPATLAIAKSNVERHYTVVGLLEDMGAFFKVLEKVQPRIFRGGVQIYTNMNSTMYSRLSTYKKVAPSEKTAERWRKMAAVEYDFYAFVKKRFYDQMHSLGLDI